MPPPPQPAGAGPPRIPFVAASTPHTLSQIIAGSSRGQDNYFYHVVLNSRRLFE
jgi:hypothetical protein